MCTDTTIYPSLSAEKDGPRMSDAQEAIRKYNEKKKKGQNYKTVKLSDLGIKTGKE